MDSMANHRRMLVGGWTIALGLAVGSLALGQAPAAPEQPAPAPGEKAKDKPEFPPFDEVSKDYTKVVSTADGAPGLFNVYRRDKDGQILAEFPRGYDNQKYFLAMTVSKGDMWAGLQGADMYVYWKRFDKKMALIAPNLEVRSTGDQESKSSVALHYTDTVIVDVPIVAIGPGGQPVIDLDALLVGQAGKFFGRQGTGLNAALARIESVKTFPENVEVAIEAPGASGQLVTLHYSIRVVPDNPAYKPREADERVGYFTTTYRDLGKYNNDKKWVRYINRWHLEKADPKVRLSPPKEPIIFYVDHTVPVRYRRYVRDGVLYWNKAYEKVGIVGAIEVYQQDKTTGAHMDKDPEDSRYNFVRWLSNDISTAIGPSRVNPLTGEIIDADIVLTDGWIRWFFAASKDLLPETAMESFGPETLAWLDTKPQWDPRLRLAHPAQRNYILAQRAQRGVQRFGGHPLAMTDAAIMGDDEFDGLVGRTSQINGMCLASYSKAMDMSTMGMSLEMLGMLEDEQPKEEAGKEGEKKDDKDKTEYLDGIPEWFIGPLLSDLVAHEVGHTLGLRHNFKASALYDFKVINSAEIKGKKPLAASVMDYNGLPNINTDPNAIQGDFGMIDIGPYDMWAIEYGYTLDDPKNVLKRVGEPEHAYATDEDTTGPDPLSRRRDLGANPLDYAKSKMELAQKLRGRILSEYVKDGESWSRARKGYLLTLRQHTDALSMMANWIGGAYTSRDKKGDPNGRPPITVVPVAQQRAALKFVIDNAFYDEAFGLSPELLNSMTVDKWFDGGGINDIFEDQTWPLHERVLGIQSAALTMLINPTTLGRVYDNESRVPAGEDALTLPEVLSTVEQAIWSELDKKDGGKFTARQPMISSLRRNLQREYLDRLIDLAGPDGLSGAAAKPVANLAVFHLRELDKKIKESVENPGRLDPYTLAHLSEANVRIEKALDAQYIYNTNAFGGMGGGFLLFNTPAQPVEQTPAQ